MSRVHKGIVEQDRDLAGRGKISECAALPSSPPLCSPSCEDHVWHTGPGTKPSKANEGKKNTDPL